MDLHNAEKQFEDNLRRYGNVHSDPEKYNLYTGLMNLAKGMRNLEDKVDRITQFLASQNQVH